MSLWILLICPLSTYHDSKKQLMEWWCSLKVLVIDARLMHSTVWVKFDGLHNVTNTLFWLPSSVTLCWTRGVMTRVQETKHSKIFYIHKPLDAFRFIKRVLIFILFEQPMILELDDPFRCFWISIHSICVNFMVSLFAFWFWFLEGEHLE